MSKTQSFHDAQSILDTERKRKPLKYKQRIDTLEDGIAQTDFVAKTTGDEDYLLDDSGAPQSSLHVKSRPIYAEYSQSITTPRGNSKRVNADEENEAVNMHQEKMVQFLEQHQDLTNDEKLYLIERARHVRLQ